LAKDQREGDSKPIKEREKRKQVASECRTREGSTKRKKRGQACPSGAGGQANESFSCFSTPERKKLSITCAFKRGERRNLKKNKEERKR